MPDNEDLVVVCDLVEGALARLSFVVKACLTDARREQSAAKLRQIRLEEAEGTYTKSQILLLLHNQKHRCAYARPGDRPAWCTGRIGFKTCHRDHIEPVARRGTNWISNIQQTCAPCNHRKHAKDPVSFARELGLLL